MKIIEEIGSEKGLQLFHEAVERQAETIEKEIKKRIPKNLSTLDAGVEAYIVFMRDTGAEVQISEKGEDHAEFAVRRCPFYEALLDVDVRCNQLQGGVCMNLAIPAIESILKRVDSRFKVEPKLIRKSSEDICLEEIRL